MMAPPAYEKSSNTGGYWLIAQMTGSGEQLHAVHFSSIATQSVEQVKFL
ncbi:MAG: hypothetical protein GY843_07035 [Neptuniibacter sp.]|nr:hypothetical protein [Neptuniibacter sp.]